MEDIQRLFEIIVGKCMSKTIGISDKEVSCEIFVSVGVVGVEN